MVTQVQVNILYEPTSAMDKLFAEIFILVLEVEMQ